MPLHQVLVCPKIRSEFIEACNLSLPTMLNDLLFQDTQSKTVELSHEDFDLRLLDEPHMGADRGADDIAEALVCVDGGGEDMVSGDGELVLVPELLA